MRIAVFGAWVLVACAGRQPSAAPAAAGAAPSPTAPTPAAAQTGAEVAPEEPEDSVASQCERLIGVVNGANVALRAATEAMGDGASDPNVVGEYETAVQLAIDEVDRLELADDGLADLAQRYGELFERSKPLGAAMAAVNDDVEAANKLVAEAEAISAAEGELVAELNAYCERSRRPSPGQAV